MYLDVLNYPLSDLIYFRLSLSWLIMLICLLAIHVCITRWWFQTFFMFTPNLGEDSHFDEHIFQMGWFNHQAEKLTNITVYAGRIPPNLTADGSTVISMIFEDHGRADCRSFVGPKCKDDICDTKRWSLSLAGCLKFVFYGRQAFMRGKCEWVCVFFGVLLDVSAIKKNSYINISGTIWKLHLFWSV